MSIIKPLMKDWLPPALVRIIRNFRSNSVSFKGDYKTWEAAAELCAGYNSQIILEKVLEAALKVKGGEAVYERDSVLFNEIQYSWPVSTALMLAASMNNGNLSVLDFGGSLGTSYFQNKKFLSRLHNLSWSVVEQTNFVEVGREKIADGCLNFYSSIDDVCSQRQPNFVLISSVLQYLSNPFELLEKITKIRANLIVIDRTPFAVDTVEKIKIQQVPSEIYHASYPCRFFNRDNLIAKMIDLNYKVVECFDALDKLSDEAKWQGFIFEKNK